MRYLIICVALFTAGGAVGPIVSGTPWGPLFWMGLGALIALIGVAATTKHRSLHG